MARVFSASLICFFLIVVVSAIETHQNNAASGDVKVRQRRQAWLPRIGRRTTLVLPRTGRPEDEFFEDSFENTLREAFRDFAAEQRETNGAVDLEPAISYFSSLTSKRADRNPPAVMMRLGKRVDALREAEALQALKRLGIRIL